MRKGISVVSLLEVAALAAAGGAILASFTKRDDARRRIAAHPPASEDIEELLEKFAAALPDQKGERMLEQGRSHLNDWR